MRKTDRVAIRLGLSLPQMMENAGIHLSDVAMEFLRTGAEISGGDTYRVAATVGRGSRSGAPPCQSRARNDRGIRELPSLAIPCCAQLDIVKRRDVPVGFDPPRETDAITDRLVGYGLRGYLKAVRRV